MSNGAKYINGVFIEEKEGQYGTYLSIGITKEGLEALQNLEASDKGWRNFTASRQKDNPTKFSAKPFVPKGQPSLVGNNGDQTSDLPF